MHFNTLRIALLATLVAAAPQPLLDTRDLRSCNNNVALSAVKLLRATAFCSSFLHISTETCIRTATVTKTIPTTISATATLTNGQTVTNINTVVVQVISTVVVDGPTNTVTATITDINTITNPIIVTVTKTNTVTSTTYPRVGGPLKRDEVLPREPNANPRVVIPPGLKIFASNVISTACSCYVPSPTVIKTTTVTKTIRPTATLSFTATVSPTIATVIKCHELCKSGRKKVFPTPTSGARLEARPLIKELEGQELKPSPIETYLRDSYDLATELCTHSLPCDQKPDIKTVTSTSSSTTTSTGPPVTSTETARATITATVQPVSYTTKTETETVTVTGRQYHHVFSYNNKCIPYNYLTLNSDVSGIPITFEGIFQWCAALCASDSSCVQIWVAHTDPVSPVGLWCMTGGGPESKTWDQTEIQCQYPPIGPNGHWYRI
ncbi:hypothetical protein PT974_07616 [Cladobotryum mycophilum]|uniref:Apple domain-containing protein n=1 Tax=Cladobotryum mycophilum TaxID=491253 RepID=A0ABR0SQ47_9HYPO